MRNKSIALQLESPVLNIWPLGLLIFLLLFASRALAADYIPVRVSQMDGSAAYEPAGNVDWTEVTPNLPLFTGDRVVTHRDSRVELELGDANFVRLGSDTDLSLPFISSGETELRLGLGDLIFRVNNSKHFRVSTPSSIVEIRKKGLYRISVDDKGRTRVIVRKGEAVVRNDSGERKVKTDQQLVVEGTQVRPDAVAVAAYRDSFDDWSDRRDATYVASKSVGYVGGSYYSGIYDLDAYGYWANYPTYGHVWVPNVAVGWSPFYNGWWVDFSLGWTWVSREPWGWLPYHHGHWVYYRPYGHWCWIPGGFNYWSPARVNFWWGNGYVGWAPAPYGNTYIDNSVTVVNNYWGNRDGLHVVRRDDFGHRNFTSDNYVRPTREVVSDFRSGLPDDLARSQMRTTARSSTSRTVQTDARSTGSPARTSGIGRRESIPAASAIRGSQPSPAGVIDLEPSTSTAPVQTSRTGYRLRTIRVGDGGGSVSPSSTSRGIGSRQEGIQAGTRQESSARGGTSVGPAVRGMFRTAESERAWTGDRSERSGGFTAAGRAGSTGESFTPDRGPQSFSVGRSGGPSSRPSGAVSFGSTGSNTRSSPGEGSVGRRFGSGRPSSSSVGTPSGDRRSSGSGPAISRPSVSPRPAPSFQPSRSTGSPGRSGISAPSRGTSGPAPSRGSASPARSSRRPN